MKKRKAIRNHVLQAVLDIVGLVLQSSYVPSSRNVGIFEISVELWFRGATES